MRGLRGVEGVDLPGMRVRLRVGVCSKSMLKANHSQRQQAAMEQTNN